MENDGRGEMREVKRRGGKTYKGKELDVNL